MHDINAWIQRKNGITLHYAEKSDLGKWPEVTSLCVPSQCLPIYFNIINGKKYCVAWQLQQYIDRQCDFIMLMLLSVFYVDYGYMQWHHQPVNMASCFLRHFLRSLILNVSFFLLTKCWMPILLSKFSENCAVLKNCKLILVSMDL